jgi:hypothetical protein
MNKNKKIGLGIVGVIVLIGVFYGGMIYGKSQIPTRGAQAFDPNNMPSGMPSGIPNAGINNVKNRAGFGGITSGEIISKDDKGITIKLQDGGSKIIFLSTTTTVAKTATGSITDLTVGTQVFVTGTTNTDGSITAQTVQIRPQTMVK